MKKRLLLWTMLLAVVAAVSFSVSGSAAPTAYVHSVWSQKPLYVADATTGQWYSATAGNAVASWTDLSLTPYPPYAAQAFFDAIVDANGDRYEFRLVKVAYTTDDEIHGAFDIYKNYALVANDIPGAVYGLSQPVGNVFKFYDSSYQWHVSGYITNRLDF